MRSKRYVLSPMRVFVSGNPSADFAPLLDRGYRAAERCPYHAGWLIEDRMVVPTTYVPNRLRTLHVPLKEVLSAAREGREVRPGRGQIPVGSSYVMRLRGGTVSIGCQSGPLSTVIDILRASNRTVRTSKRLRRRSRFYGFGAVQVRVFANGHLGLSGVVDNVIHRSEVVRTSRRLRETLKALKSGQADRI